MQRNMKEPGRSDAWLLRYRIAFQSFSDLLTSTLIVVFDMQYL